MTSHVYPHFSVIMMTKGFEGMFHRYMSHVVSINKQVYNDIMQEVRLEEIRATVKNKSGNLDDEEHLDCVARSYFEGATDTRIYLCRFNSKLLYEIV